MLIQSRLNAQIIKVLPFQIPKPLYRNLIVQEDRGADFYGRLHQHEEIQLSLVLVGKGKLIVGDSVHTFETGDFFAIGPHSPHLFKNEGSGEDVHMISLFFTVSTYGEGFFDNPDMEAVRPFFGMISEGFQVMGRKKILRDIMQSMPKLDKLERFVHLLRLLKLLSKTKKRQLTGFLYPKGTSAREGNHMQSLFDFTIKNFRREITLKEAADQVHMTTNAFCRFFKRRTDKTYFQFLIELRIEHACQLLIKNEGDLSISDVAEQSGFTSISNFNRKFRKLKGTVPSKFAKRK